MERREVTRTKTTTVSTSGQVVVFILKQSSVGAAVATFAAQTLSCGVRPNSLHHHFCFKTTHLMKTLQGSQKCTCSLWTIIHWPPVCASPLNWGRVSWKGRESHLEFQLNTWGAFRKPCKQTAQHCLLHSSLCIHAFEFKPKYFLQPEATAREEGGGGEAVGAGMGGGGRFVVSSHEKISLWKWSIILY